MVDLRSQLASALSSRNSLHASAERADEAAEDLAVQVRLATGTHGLPPSGWVSRLTACSA